MYIVYESRRGRARRAAESVAEAAAARGVPTLLRSIEEAVPDDILEAPALIAGCWTKIDTPHGGETVQSVSQWFETLPELHGKPVGLFCSYTFFPHTFADTATRTAEALARLTRAVETKGGKVVSSHSLHFQAFDKGAEELVAEVLEHTPG
jgi:flavodoxin